jgi:hypothetical protein
MSRTISTEVVDALGSDNVPILMFVEMDFPDGFLRCCNAGYTVDWDGHEWLGAGYVGSMDPISETSELQANGLSFTLSGVPPENIALALGQHYQGRACKVWLAPLDATSYVPLVDPMLVFSGRMDTMDIQVGETATIKVSAESRLADWDRPRVRRYNHADQTAIYPDDMGFEFVEKVAEMELLWGRA